MDMESKEKKDSLVINWQNIVQFFILITILLEEVDGSVLNICGG